MKTVQEFLGEAKKAPKGGYDIGDGFSVTKVGHDTNGNWSYWVAKGGAAKKIQTGNLNGGSGKIINVHDFKNINSGDAKKAVSLIKDYAKNFLKFKV